MKYYRIDFQNVTPITETEYISRYNNDDRDFIVWYDDAKNCFIGVSNCPMSTVIKAVIWVTGEYNIKYDCSGCNDFVFNGGTFYEFLKY